MKQSAAMKELAIARMAKQRRNSEEAKLKNQQQRLFLLNHAQNCTANDGECRHVYCLEMKDLLNHMASCKDSKCNVRNCLSSRFLVGHFNHCKDNECTLCDPVKEALWDEEFKGTKRKLNFNEEHCCAASKRKLTF